MTTTRASILLLVTLVASPARAQTPEAPMAAADRLFREGRSALEAGRYAEACPTLAQSQQLDTGMGTLLALALCAALLAACGEVETLLGSERTPSVVVARMLSPWLGVRARAA